MKVMVITSSPNANGLTAACGMAAEQGAKSAGAEVTLLDLNHVNVGTCNSCGNGWGPCLDKHQCQVEDEFQSIHNSMAEFDAFVIITPVYWGEMSESAKTFFDRLRRCEAWKKDGGYLQDKPVICVAAAGGSGNGFVNCLSIMERLMMHLKTERYDFIGITRKNREYKLVTIQDSTKQMVLDLINKVSK